MNTCKRKALKLCRLSSQDKIHPSLAVRNNTIEADGGASENGRRRIPWKRQSPDWRDFSYV